MGFITGVTIMRTFAYCRVSTNEQTTDNQVLELERAGYALETHRIIVETISGSVASMERKEFKNLIDNKLEPLDRLIITKLDRLGRNMIDVLATIEMLKIKQIELVCLQVGNIDLNSASGKLFLNVFAMVAQFEKDLLKERTKAGLERAKAQGKQLGRPSVLTDKQKEEVKAKLTNGQSARSLGFEYGVSRPLIVKIKKELAMDEVKPI